MEPSCVMGKGETHTVEYTERIGRRH